MNYSYNKSIKHFLSGLLFLIPLIITWQIFKSISGIVKTFFPSVHGFPAFFISLFLILITGYLISKIFKRSVRAKIIHKSKNKEGFFPLYKLLANYKQISEKTKKSFSKPVFYKSSEGIEKIGFITNTSFNLNSSQEKLIERIPKESVSVLIAQEEQDLDKNKKIAVYAPNPINFMGELLFIDKDLITEIPKEERHSVLMSLVSAGILHKNDIV